MFVEDIKNDFYNTLLGNRVLLLVHYDVDAICTCKILQELFKCDNISYTLVPVGGISELKTAYEENNEEIKYVVLVNCGGTIDLVDILQPEEDVVFFVLDSHKPSDVCNVYSDGQVRLVYKDNEENIPNFEDIFREDDDDDEEEGLEGGREALEAVVERRRAKRAWEEKRNTLMFNYTQFSYYGKPSACVSLELAWRLSRVSVGAVWCAGVSCAAQQALQQRAGAACVLDAEALARHVAAHHTTNTNTNTNTNNTDTYAHDHDQHAAKVVLEKDVWLPLYRVWSLENALRHAPTLGPHLKLHTLAGAGKLRQLLADMGYPLQQARQWYRSMDVELRRGLAAALEAAAGRRGLPPPARAAALLRRPHAPARAAHDLVYALLALLHHETIPKEEGFQHALSALSVHGGDVCCEEALALGVGGAKRALQAVARVVGNTLAAKQLHLAGPFSYFIVQEGSAESRVLGVAWWLGVAARWVSAAGGGSRPVLASAPLDAQRCLLLGVPPRFEHEPRNLFGAAFEQAAARSGASVSQDHVDSSVVTLPTAQRTQFLDALTALLA